jgi:hypothetical protein
MLRGYQYTSAKMKLIQVTHSTKPKLFENGALTPHSIVLDADCFEGGRWSIFVMEL